MTMGPTQSSFGHVAFRFALGLVASLLLVGCVVWFANPGEIVAAWASARVRPLTVAALLYLTVLVVRWIRLAGLVDAANVSGHRLELLWASAGHSFATQLLPARSGELVFPELWRRATDTSYAEGAVYLMAIRVVELGIVVPLYAAGLMTWFATRGDGSPPFWLLSGLVVFGLGLLVALPLLLRFALRIAAWVLLETRLSEVESLEKLRAAVPRAREAIERLGPLERVWLVVTSLAMWLLLFAVFAFTISACGVQLPIAQTVVGSGGGIVGNLLPIGGIGSLGTMEAGWTAAFRATGAPLGPIVASGLLVHAIVIVGTGLTTALAAVATALLTND